MSDLAAFAHQQAEKNAAWAAYRAAWRVAARRWLAVGRPPHLALWTDEKDLPA